MTARGSFILRDIGTAVYLYLQRKHHIVKYVCIGRIPIKTTPDDLQENSVPIIVYKTLEHIIDSSDLIIFWVVGPVLIAVILQRFMAVLYTTWARKSPKPEHEFFVLFCVLARFITVHTTFQIYNLTLHSPPLLTNQTIIRIFLICFSWTFTALFGIRKFCSQATPPIIKKIKATCDNYRSAFILTVKIFLLIVIEAGIWVSIIFVWQMWLPKRLKVFHVRECISTCATDGVNWRIIIRLLMFLIIGGSLLGASLGAIFYSSRLSTALFNIINQKNIKNFFYSSLQALVTALITILGLVLSPIQVLAPPFVFTARFPVLWEFIFNTPISAECYIISSLLFFFPCCIYTKKRIDAWEKFFSRARKTLGQSIKVLHQ
jgi:hypothetical protein